MRIDQVRIDPTQKPARIVRRQTGFAVAEDAGQQQVEMDAPAPPSSAGLIAIVAHEPPCHSPAQPDACAARHGQAVLDALSALQLASLGPHSGSARAALASSASAPMLATDPELSAVLEAIAVRAAVELARTA